MGRLHHNETKNRKRSTKQANATSTVGRTLIKKSFGNKRPTVADPFAQKLSNNESIEAPGIGPVLQSVTEQTDLSDLLDVAMLSQRNFEAERERSTTLISTAFAPPPPRHMEFEALRAGHEQLTIPRRPSWNKDMTSEQLQHAEQAAFLEWRRGLAVLEEQHGLILTPFERNLDFWRQLWRVVEQSDVVLFIVDARNPFLFRCGDLERCIREYNGQVIFLANKADLVPPEYRRVWKNYFNQQLNTDILFFSATHALKHIEVPPVEDESGFPRVAVEEPQFYDDVGRSDIEDSIKVLTVSGLFSHLKSTAQNMSWKSEQFNGRQIFKVGMVGYPNVGKSSCINALAGRKCVSVAATPGKTKHFQTVPLAPRFHLVDCPGLVFPAALFSKSELAISGILHADTLRDTITPMMVVNELISFNQINSVYHTEFTAKPKDPYHLLNAISEKKGIYAAGSGNFDVSRAGRIVLKDIFNGKIRYCCRPYPCDTYLPDIDTCPSGLVDLFESKEEEYC
ncbi:hypothetical protein RCL1_004103 [Eukaryota sp. TZLM3-RCL]